MSDAILVTLEQQQDYQFQIHFAGVPAAVLTDEPAPLGQGTGPSPMHLLCAAVGNCLSDSLLFALRKFHQKPEPLRSEVRAVVGRNEAGRLRVLQLHVRIDLGTPAAALEHLDRALAQFESFCTVSQSVGQGIPIVLQVRDSTGAVLKGENPPY